MAIDNKKKKTFDEIRSKYGFKTESNTDTSVSQVSNNSFESIRAKYGFGTSANRNQTSANTNRITNNTNSLGVSFEGRSKPSAPNLISTTPISQGKVSTEDAQKQYDAKVQEIANLYAQAQKEYANKTKLSDSPVTSDLGSYKADIERAIKEKNELEKLVNVGKSKDYYNEGKNAAAKLKEATPEVDELLNKYVQLKYDSEMLGMNGSSYAMPLANERIKLSSQIKQLTGWNEKDFNNIVDQYEYVKNQEDAAKREAELTEYSKDNPVLASVWRTANNVASGLGAADILIQKLENRGTDKPVDTNTYLNTWANEAQIAEEAVLSTINNDFGKAVYSTAMGMVDSMIMAGISAGVGGMFEAPKVAETVRALTTDLIMGSSVATREFKNNIEKGYSENQALMSSFLKGAIEGVTEAVSIEKIIGEVKKGEKLWKMFAKSGVTEAQEELASNWLGRVVDVVIDGGEELRNNYEQNFNKAIADGKSKKDAFFSALWNTVGKENLTTAFLSFLSGGVMGSGFTAIARAPEGISKAAEGVSKISNNISVLEEIRKNYGNYQKNDTNRNNMLSLIEEGKAFEEGSRAYNKANSLEDKMRSGKNISAMNIQSIINEYAKARNNEGNNAQNTRALMSAEAAESGLNVRNEINRNVSPTLTQPNVANIDNTAVAEKNQRLRPTGAQIMGADGRGEAVAVNLFKDVDKGEVYISNGETKTLGQVAFDDDAQRDLYFAATEKGYDTETANAMLQGYSDTPGYTEAFDYFYKRGTTGESFDFEGSAHSTQINSIVAHRAFALGRQKLEQNRSSAVSRQNSRTVKEAKGGVYFTRDYSQKHESELSKKQKSQLKLIEEYANEHKVHVSVVASLGNRRNGMYDPNTDTITISLDARANAYIGFFSHELLHRIKAQDINSYHELVNEIINNYLSKDSKFDLEGRIREVKALYKKEAKQELSREEAIEEIVANSVIPALSDRQFIESVVENKKTLAEKISEWVNELINELNKILDRLSNIAEVREVRKDVQLLENIRNIIDESVSKTGGIREAHGESKEAIIGLPDGKRYVQADEQVIKSNNPDEWESEIINYVNKQVRKGKDISIPLSDGSELLITGRTAWKLGYRNGFNEGNPISDNIYFVKGNAAGVIDEIVETSIYDRTKPPKKQRITSFAEKGFDYRYSFFRDLDGKYYRLDLSVGLNTDSKEVYNIGKIKEVPFPVSGSKAAKGKTPYSLNVSQDNEAVNNIISQNKNKYSINEPESEIAQLKDDLKAAQIREENLSSTINTQQQIIKSLKAEFEITKGHILNRNKIEVLAKKLLYKYSSSYDSAKLSDNLQKLFDYIANDKNVDWYSVMDVSTAIVKEIISKSTRTNRDLYNQYADMREYFRKTKFNIPEEIRAEVGEYYGGWNNFRRQNFGRFNLTNEGFSLDSYWNEISEAYPEFFDAEATPQEQVMQVVEALESIQPYTENPFELNMDEYAYDLALDIYDEYFNIPEVKTFADKQAQKLEQQRIKLSDRWKREKERIKAKNERTIVELKAANNAKIQKLTEKYNKAQGETKQYYRDMISRLRDKSNERLIKQKAVLTEQKSKEVQRVRDLREAEKIKTGIRKIMLDFSSKLLTNTDKKHIKKEFVADIVEVCELVLGKYNNKQMRDKLSKIQTQYAALKTEDGLNLTDYTDIVVEDIARLNAILEDKTINVLTMEELRETYDVLKEIRHTLAEANRAFATEKREKIEELGGAVSSELRKEKYKEQIASKTLDLLNRFGWSNLKPIYAFKFMGSKTFEQLYENVRKGEDVYAVDMQEAKDVIEAASKTYKKTSWDMEKSEKFKTVYGDEITFNLGQKMSIYALSKREQAMKHLLEGGITFEDPATTKKGLIKYKSNNPVSTPLTATDIANIINSLTEQQRAYVDVMQKYLSTELSAKGNEVTNVLYGIDRFNEKNYFPIKSNKMFIDFNVAKSSQDNTIKNAAFTKGTVKNANNAVVIGDFDSVWGKHVVDMSLYHGLTLPLEDFKRVYNYKESVNTSVKTLLNASFGESAGQYIETLLKDINGGVQISQTEKFAKALIALRKSSAVAASLSVAFQQPSSIVRATAIIDPKYFITKPTKQSYDELLKYAPIARVKEMGYFDMSIGKSATDWLITNEADTLKEKIDLAFKDKKALKGQLDDLWFALPGMADRLTWSQIWEACKREQMSKGNYFGSEEHLKAAAKRFTEVIELTQVYDSVFARNELMRSKSVFTQAFTSFMAEPSVTLNMAAYGISKLKTDKAYAARVAASLIGSIIANALLKSFVTAARDDDEENNYWEVYTADVVNNVFDDMNALNYIPIVRDVQSLLQGYDVSRPDTELIGELIDSVTNVSKKISKGEAEAKDILDAINNVFAVFRIPTKNIARDIKSFFNVIDKAKFGEKFSKAGLREEMIKGNTLRNVLAEFGFNTQLNESWLYTSMIFDKDEAQTAFIRELLRESGKTDEHIDKKLKEFLAADADIHEYAKKYADGDIEAFNEAIEYYGGLGFNEKDVASAIRSYVDKTINGEEKATTQTAAGTLYQYDDLYNAIDRNDLKDVKSISQALVTGYTKNGKTLKEAKSLVKNQLTTKYKDKYINANGSERRKIREALYNTLAYDSYEALDKILKNWIK